MRPSVRRLEETYSDRVDFHILNIDRLSTTPLATTYDIAGIPAIILLDANGDVAQRYLGFRTEEQLATGIEALLAAHEPAPWRAHTGRWIRFVQPGCALLSARACDTMLRRVWTAKFAR